MQYPFRRAGHHARRVGQSGASRARPGRLRAVGPLVYDTVAAIAVRWEFADPTRFATGYRAAYGPAQPHSDAEGATASLPATAALVRSVGGAPRTR